MPQLDNDLSKTLFVPSQNNIYIMDQQQQFKIFETKIEVKRNPYIMFK